MNDANKLPKCRLIALPQFSPQSVKLQSLIRADSFMHFPARQKTPRGRTRAANAAICDWELLGVVGRSVAQIVKVQALHLGVIIDFLGERFGIRDTFQGCISDWPVFDAAII